MSSEGDGVGPETPLSPPAPQWGWSGVDEAGRRGAIARPSRQRQHWGISGLRPGTLVTGESRRQTQLGLEALTLMSP